MLCCLQAVLYLPVTGALVFLVFFWIDGHWHRFWKFTILTPRPVHILDPWVHKVRDRKKLGFTLSQRHAGSWSTPRAISRLVANRVRDYRTGKEGIVRRELGILWKPMHTQVASLPYVRVWQRASVSSVCWWLQRGVLLVCIFLSQTTSPALAVRTKATGIMGRTWWICQELGRTRSTYCSTHLL